MPRLVVAPEARQDLREIRDHIATDNPGAARRVVGRVRNMARLLASAAALGRDRPELGAHIRSFADRYVLFYRPLRRAAGIELVRVLHGAREVDAILSGEKD
jgi:toxin ParE1/3/4